MIDAKTKLFSVIGDPIGHSLSPIMHNAVFKGLDLNCAYVAFKVGEAELANAIGGFRALGIGGFNVTTPHKIRVIEFLDEVSEEVELIGACNTVKNDGGELVGYNTDGMGALEALKKTTKVEGKGVLVLGAGGASRAICFQLALEKVGRLTIANRTLGKAEQLAKEISEKTGCNANSSNVSEDGLKGEISEVEMMINTTSVGMHPNIDETLVTSDMMDEHLVVMDIVYNPLETRLLKEAKKAGAKTVDGLGMFVYQGAEALRIWLGIEPPIGLMRGAVLRKLQKIDSKF
ncbi:MAG: shikimate dehydrogenase [Candidatus Hydrothermarchaeales archaeon]